MKKIIILISIILILSGCTAQKITLAQIDTNLSSSNPNIAGNYANGVYSGSEFTEFTITSESFEDITKADNQELLDEETYYAEVEQYEEWMLPQYDEMIQELTNTKYTKIDDISGTDGLLTILENKDNGFKLYIYEDNKIKVIDGDDSASYQADSALEYTNSLLEDFGIKITDFFTEMKKDVASKQQIDDKNENAPICEEDGAKTVYYEEKIGNPHSKSEGCKHYTFGTDRVWYQDYVNFYQCPECGEKIDEENITIEVDRECFGHN